MSRERIKEIVDKFNTIEGSSEDIEIVLNDATFKTIGVVYKVLYHKGLDIYLVAMKFASNRFKLFPAMYRIEHYNTSGEVYSSQIIGDLLGSDKVDSKVKKDIEDYCLKDYEFTYYKELCKTINTFEGTFDNFRKYEDNTINQNIKSVDEVYAEIKKILDDNNCFIRNEYDPESSKESAYLIRSYGDILEKKKFKDLTKL